MTLMRGVGLVVLTPQGVRQRSHTSRTALELRSLAGPCLSSVAGVLLLPHSAGLVLNLTAMQPVLTPDARNTAARWAFLKSAVYEAPYRAWSGLQRTPVTSPLRAVAGWSLDGSNKHRTFTQETAVHV